MKRASALVAAAVAMLAVPGAAVALGGLFVREQPGSPAGAIADDTWNQVRIEQHLIIRITPGDPGVPRDALPPPPETAPERLRERKFAKCVPVSAIGGVRAISETRVVLFLRDRRMVGADLARGCTARDFYMGFYVSPTSDGALCVDRDTIHSRAGASCTITRLREILPAN